MCRFINFSNDEGDTKPHVPLQFYLYRLYIYICIQTLDPTCKSGKGRQKGQIIPRRKQQGQANPYIGHFLDTLGPTLSQNHQYFVPACNSAQVSSTFLPLLPLSRHLSTLFGSSQHLWWHSNARQVEKSAATIEGLQKLHQQRGREDPGHPNYAAILETLADALPSEKFPMRFSPGCSNHLRTVWSVLSACLLECVCVCMKPHKTQKLCSSMHQHTQRRSTHLILSRNVLLSDYLIWPANMIFTFCIPIPAYVHMQVTAH